MPKNKIDPFWWCRWDRELEQAYWEKVEKPFLLKQFALFDTDEFWGIKRKEEPMNWKKAWASKKVRERGEWLEARVVELEGLVSTLTKLKDEREAECRLRAKLIQALRDVNAHMDGRFYAEAGASEGV